MFRGNSKFLLKKGSLMVEVLIVTSIITVCVLAALSVAQKSITLSRQSVHQSQASFLMEEGAEAVRIRRDGGWSGISGLINGESYYISFSGGVWNFSLTPSQTGIFTRRISVANAYRDGSQNLASSGTVDSQAKLVTVTVSWVESGQTITKTMQFYIFDIFS